MMRRFLLLAFMISVCVSAHAQVVVTLDEYFNHETRKNKAGETERFHYLWQDTTNTGFSILGKSFKKHGGVLHSLPTAPTTKSLKGSSIYVIVDPDSKKENPDPHYIGPKDVDEIEKWVKAGGVLFLLANDSANVELPHFNQLAARFGMHFNNDMQNHVIDDNHFKDGALVTAGNPVFGSAKKIFMKDVCSISLSDNAQPVIKSKDAVIIASAKYGKGFVLAVGDPWLYNEYTNGRLPADFENDKAANDIAGYLIKQAKRGQRHNNR